VIKHPVVTAFLIAVVIALALMGYMLAESRTVDEKPFIFFYSLVALPFAWFFVWIFLGAIAWWQEITAEPPPDAAEPAPDDDPNSVR
jgi:hypothetical protein